MPSSSSILSSLLVSFIYLALLLSSSFLTETTSGFSAKLPRRKKSIPASSAFVPRGIIASGLQQRQEEEGRTLSSTTTELKQSSFAADGSEYSSADGSSGGDFDGESDEAGDKSGIGRTSYRDEDDDTPTVELEPLPLSKNAGNRFVAFVWDRELVHSSNGKQQQQEEDDNSKDALDLHYDRISLTEEHVMYCRKANLYNETFNTESMVDILWSLPMYVFPHRLMNITRSFGLGWCCISFCSSFCSFFFFSTPLSAHLGS